MTTSGFTCSGEPIFYGVLLAGGRGNRLKESASKISDRDGFPSNVLSLVEQLPTKSLIPILGSPLIVRSLQAILASNLCKHVVVVVPEEFKQEFAFLCDGLPDNLISLVGGGETRLLSLKRGISHIVDRFPLDDRSFLLIHDAARCCVVPQDIVKTAETACGCAGGAILANSATDTIKLSDMASEGVRIKETLDRDRIWLAGTPQIMRARPLLDVIGDMREEAVFTDDAGLIEDKFEVGLVEAAIPNIKVTTIWDVVLVEAILRNLGKAYLQGIGNFKPYYGTINNK